MNNNCITNRYQRRLLPVLQKIQEELNSDLDLASLSRTARMSEYHFHRVFKAIVGENLKEYVRRLRLEKAAGLLRDTDRRILDIALEAGFSSHEAFTRAFRKAFNLTPLEYRNCSRNFSGTTSEPGFTAPNLKFKLKEYGEVSMQVEQTYLEEMTVIYRHHIGSDNNISAVWGEMIRWGHSEKIIDASTRFITIGYDDPGITAPDKQRFDLCFTCNAKPTGSFPAKSKKIAGFKVAKVVHQGDLSGIESTFMAFYANWLPNSGLEPAEHPPLVEYLNSPFNTATDDLRTALYIPLQ